MANKTRFIPNKLEDFNGKKFEYSLSLKKKFCVHVEELVGVIITNYPHDSDLRRPSVYNGLAGVAYMFLEIHFYNKYFCEDQNLKISCPKKEPLEWARFFIKKSKEKMERLGGKPSFISGIPGIYCLDSVISYEEGKEKQTRKAIQTVLQFSQNCQEPEKTTEEKEKEKKEKKDSEETVCDEHLNGRIGYLHSLLYLNAHLPPSSFPSSPPSSSSSSSPSSSSSSSSSSPSSSSSSSLPPSLLSSPQSLSVLEQIFEKGQKKAKKYEKYEKKRKQDCIPLLFSWHGKYYLGGAHGVSGIFFSLLFFDLKEKEKQLVKESIDFIIQTCQYPSGNYRTRLYDNTGESGDRLVQWCHGAPGVIMMLCHAFVVFGDNLYLEEAEKAGEIVWERGLLKKGFGVCHGTGGSGFSLLSLYRVTGKERWLFRALKIGEFGLNYREIEKKYQASPPDNPFSLFQGLSGFICFYLSLLSPQNSHFPAFEIQKTV